MYAGKGVAIVIPDDIRPIAMNCNKPIDCIFNSFGIYSRMNLSQIIEGVVAKEIMTSEEKILNDPNYCITEIEKINENIIKNFNTKNYYNDVNQLINDLKQDSNKVNEFVEDVRQNGLFIEAPAFSEINIRELIKHNNSHIENIQIKKETLHYFKDKLKINFPFTINNDLIIKNKFCAPIYMMKLHKIVSEIVTARDLGKCKFITKQPIKGRINEGGKKLGQMEIEAIVSHGCMKSLKELLTIKSDYVDQKKDFLKDIILNGEFNMGEHKEIQGETKKVVDTLIKFLND